MDIKAFFTSELDQHRAVLAATEGALEEPFRRLVEACLAAVRGGNANGFGDCKPSTPCAGIIRIRFEGSPFGP